MNKEGKIAKLRQLGVYQEWMQEMTKNCGAHAAIAALEMENKSFESFILRSFIWSNSKQGADFWKQISKS